MHYDFHKRVKKVRMVELKVRFKIIVMCQNFIEMRVIRVQNIWSHRITQ